MSAPVSTSQPASAPNMPQSVLAAIAITITVGGDSAAANRRLGGRDPGANPSRLLEGQRAQGALPHRRPQALPLLRPARLRRGGRCEGRGLLPDAPFPGQQRDRRGGARGRDLSADVRPKSLRLRCGRRRRRGTRWVLVYVLVGTVGPWSCGNDV